MISSCQYCEVIPRKTLTEFSQHKECNYLLRCASNLQEKSIYYIVYRYIVHLSITYTYSYRYVDILRGMDLRRRGRRRVYEKSNGGYYPSMVLDLLQK